MSRFEGIPIREQPLLIRSIAFTVLFLLALAVSGLLLWVVLSSRDRKALAHLRRLRKRAETDPVAQKRLERLERRRKRRRKQSRAERITEFALLFMVVGIAVAALCAGVIPCWTDYVRKDHVVYTGEIEVVRYTRHAYVRLRDGTTLAGGFRLDESDTQATVVYARRSHVLLGSQ